MAQIWRFKLEISGPLMCKPAWTFEVVYAGFDQEHDGHPSHGHWIDAQGHLAHWFVRYMMEHMGEPAYEYMMKNMKQILGGPGNRTQVPMVTIKLILHYASWTLLLV